MLGDPPVERTVQKVRQLISEAETQPAGGFRAVLARRSWSRLARAHQSSMTDRYRVYRAVLDDWAAAGAPDDPRPELLARWVGGRRRFAVHLMTLAQPPDHPQWASIAAYCVRHDILPKKPADRVRFLALTGQAERRRALDPDGSLLARAYGTAHRRTRARLREVLAGDGVDVLEIIAEDAHRRTTRLSPEEREYLASELARRRDWAGLWRLARDLPVIDAAGVARLIDPGWRADAQRDRDLLTLLARADPALLRDAREALHRGCVVRVEVPGEIVAGALSVDGKRLAVTTADPGPRGPRAPWNQGWVSVFGLPDGQVLDRHQVPVRDFAGLVFRGAALFAVDSAAARSAGGAATGAAEGAAAQADKPGAPLTRVYRFADGRGQTPPTDDSAPVVAVVPRNRGLAAVRADGVLACYGNDGARFAECQLGAADGFARAGVVAAAEPGRGHIAIADGSRVITVDVRDPYRARVVSRIADKIPVTGLCFDGAGGIIVADRDEVRRWPVSAPSAAANGEYETGTLGGGHSLVTVGGRDEICLLDRAGAVRYLDKRTLRPVSQRRELTGMTGTALWGQADGPGHALAGDGAVHVAVSPPGLRTLTTRPQATWRAADAATARAVAAIAERSPAARPFYNLLTACLEYRFGSG